MSNFDANQSPARNRPAQQLGDGYPHSDANSVGGVSADEASDHKARTSGFVPGFLPHHRHLLRLTTIVLLGVLFLEWFVISRRRPQPLVVERGSTFHADYAIDINTANWVEWSQLEGVGPGLAHRIVAHRRVLGGFRSIEDLLQVPGIGQAKLDVIKPRLTIRYEQSESQYVDKQRQSFPDAAVEAQQPSAIR